MLIILLSYALTLAIREDAPDVKSILLNSDMGFFEVPALNVKSPSTRFKIRGHLFHVDLLTPLIGPDNSSPVKLKQFKSYGHPTRFLDFILNDAQIAVGPFRSGVLVNVPSPARFAFHISDFSTTPCCSTNKSKKDIMQAEMQFNVLLVDSPVLFGPFVMH